MSQQTQISIYNVLFADYEYYSNYPYDYQYDYQYDEEEEADRRVDTSRADRNQPKTGNKISPAATAVKPQELNSDNKKDVAPANFPKPPAIAKNLEVPKKSRAGSPVESAGVVSLPPVPPKLKFEHDSDYYKKSRNTFDAPPTAEKPGDENSPDHKKKVKKKKVKKIFDGGLEASTEKTASKGSVLVGEEENIVSPERHIEVKPVKPVEPVKAAEPVKAVEQVKATEPVKTAEPVKAVAKEYMALDNPLEDDGKINYVVDYSLVL